MNKAVPWSIKGVDFDAREAAREAARRSGMSVGEWLNSVIADQASEMGVEVDDIDETDRLEAVTARLAQMSGRPRAKAVRRGDAERSEDFLRRRKPTATLRERYDGRDDYDREPVRHYEAARPAGPDPERLLDDAIRAFERGTRRSSEQTATAISQVARRLEDIESRLEGGRPEAPQPAQDAIAKLEARVEALARRREPDSAESSLKELERKIAAMAEKKDAKPPAEAPSDLARIEAKLNRLLDGASKPAQAPQPFDAAPGVRGATAPARLSLADAISQITRKQSSLETGAVPARAAPPAYAPTPPVGLSGLQNDIAVLSQRVELTRRELLERSDALRPSPAIDLSPLQSDIANLSARLEQTRREIIDRADARPASSLDLAPLQSDIAGLSSRLEQARRDVIERTDAARNAPVAQAPEIDQLRRQIDEISRALRDLAPRDAIVSVETAIADLARRIEASRQSGVRENLLRPIEQLATDIRHSLSELSPAAGLQSLEREVRAMAAKVDAAREPGFDARALREIQAQTQEMRDLLMSAVSRPAPIESIERQIMGLSERLDRFAHRAPSPIDDVAVARGIGEIRQSLGETFDASVIHQLEDKIEALGRKIDDAVSQSNASDQFDELAGRIDNMQRSLADRSAPTVAASIDTSALEKMMRELAVKLEKPAPPDTNRLESLVHSLSERLSTAGAPQADLHLVESLQNQIAKLTEKVDAAGQSRTDGRVIEQLKTEMERLGDRLSQKPSDVDSKFTDALQQQMALLAERLDQGDASARVLVTLEGTLSDLIREVEGLRTAATDAARTAARATLAEALKTQPFSATPNDAITRDLADIRSMQDSADKRTQATLSAVHETLEKVVDRLALLEDDLAEVRPEPLASGPAPVFARPSLSAVDSLPNFAPAAGFAPSKPTEPEARPRPSPAAAAPLDSTLDELIEPGSGRRPQPQANTPAPDAPRPQEQNAQASFIAAARRAAQAASQAPAAPPKGAGKAAASNESVLASARERAKAAHLALAGTPPPAAADGEPLPTNAGGPLAKVRQFVNTRKRLVIIALVGAAAVAGSLQAVKVFRGSRPQVVDLTEQKTSDRATPEAARQSVAALAPRSGSVDVADKLIQTPPDLSNMNKLTPPGAVDASPVGTIGAKTNGSPPSLQDAAAAGDVNAQFELASRYFDGRTVARDPKLAAEWFEKAAQKNSAPAQYRLGSLYERGVGVERDPKRARDWYQRAAEAGNIRAMHNLAVISAEASDGKPDYATASSWFRKAAEYGVRDSQYNLGILYARGLGVEQNLQQSWLWFSLAAAQGDEDAANKRDDVTSRLDAKGLAAARALLAGFKVAVADKAANEVTAPAGGWDGKPAQATTRPMTMPQSFTLPPSVKPAAKGKAASI